MPIFIGTQDPIIDIEDTIIVDIREPALEEEEEALIETKDTDSLGALGSIGTDEVNSTGNNMPKGPRSKEPRIDDLVTITLKRRYYIIALNPNSQREKSKLNDCVLS
jgi:hypothetical protein